MGFGWSFYGFFVCAALWLTVYFLWSAALDRRARRRGDR